MKRLISMAFIFALGLVMFSVPMAYAHAFLDQCTPEVGSTVKQAPSEVRCTFTEGVDVKQTVFAVYDAKNNQVDNKDLKSDPSDKDGKTVVVTLSAAKIANGIYTVTWQTVSQDGDSTNGQWQFAIGTDGVPSVSIVSPTMDSKFDSDPSDVPITIKANNFQLGQGGRRWQVFLDDKLVTQVTDGSVTTTLKGVVKGDHALNVALATDDKTVVATAGMHLGVGPEDQMSAAPAVQQPAASTATGAANQIGIGIALVLGLIVVVGAVVLIARRRSR